MSVREIWHREKALETQMAKTKYLNSMKLLEFDTSLTQLKNYLRLIEKQVQRDKSKGDHELGSTISTVSIPNSNLNFTRKRAEIP